MCRCGLTVWRTLMRPGFGNLPNPLEVVVSWKRVFEVQSNTIIFYTLCRVDIMLNH